MAPEPCPCGRIGCYMPDPHPVHRLVVTEAIENWVESQGITMAELKRDDRRPSVMLVRRSVAHYLRRHEWSLNEIGRFLDREHTTVVNLLREDKAPLEVVVA